MIFLYFRKVEFALFIVILIVINLIFFYSGLELGGYFKEREIEGRALLPESAKTKVSVAFPIYSGFNNLSSIKGDVDSKENVFFVQVGAYKDLANAKKEGRKLEEKGFKSEIKEGKLNLLFVVGKGGEKEKEELKERLKKAGIRF